MVFGGSFLFEWFLVVSLVSESQHESFVLVFGRDFTGFEVVLGGFLW